MFRLLKILFFLFFITSIIVTGSGLYWFFIPPEPHSKRAFVEVPEGANFAQVTHLLTEQNVIQWPWMLRACGRVLGVDAHVRTGVYEFTGPTRPLNVLDKLMKGTVILTEFSHPPGWNMWQIAQRLSQKFPHISETQWIATFKDPAIVKTVAPGAKTLEGYLFPDVYRIRSNAKASEVVLMMTTQFKKNLTSEIIREGAARGLTPHQIVTLASIIEKETGAPTERPLIASVFFNRLKKNMRLQTDPTVIYGIWERFDGNLRRSDLETPTDYNTYTMGGLPPGPIANPGFEALHASVNPASAPYLYFVAKGDGTHYFSQTLNEHVNAVRRFQILPSQRKTSSK